MKRIVYVTASLFFCASVLIINSCVDPARDDERESLSYVTVDNTGDVGMYSSLSVDGDNICIAYYDATNTDLKFAKSVDGGVTWPSSGIVTVDESTGDVGRFAASAVIGGDLFINYYDQTGGNLKNATSADSGATWPYITFIDGDTALNLWNGIDGDVGSYCSSAVHIEQGLNKLLVSYYNSDSQNLYFAYIIPDRTKASAPSVTFTVIDSAAGVGTWNSLAHDGAYLYASYYDAGNGDLKCAISTDNQGSGWNTPVTVDSEGNTGTHTAIAALSGTAFVSYYDVTNARLKYAYYNGSAWSTGVVDEGDVGQYSSLAYDGTVVYVSYYDSGNSDLKFAKSTDSGATWEVSTIDSIGDTGLYSSITVYDAKVMVSYYSATDSSLRFAMSEDSGVTWHTW